MILQYTITDASLFQSATDQQRLDFPKGNGDSLSGFVLSYQTGPTTSMDLPTALLFKSLTTKPVHVFHGEYGGGRG